MPWLCQTVLQEYATVVRKIISAQISVKLRMYVPLTRSSEHKWAPSSEFVSSSIPSWHILIAHAQPFRGARDLAFCLKVPLDSLLVWASSEGSGETAWMRRLAWTFAARIGDKYQSRLTRPKCPLYGPLHANNKDTNQPAHAEARGMSPLPLSHMFQTEAAVFKLWFLFGWCISKPFSSSSCISISCCYFYLCWSFGTVRFNTFILKQSFAQSGSGRRDGSCRICYYLSWTDLVKPESAVFKLLMSYFQRISFVVRHLHNTSRDSLQSKQDYWGADWFGLTYCYMIGFLMTLLIYFQWCKYPCHCLTEDLDCATGVSIVRDGCGCCQMCARQHGDICNAKDICDTKQGLYCDHSHPHGPGTGICRGTVMFWCTAITHVHTALEPAYVEVQ